MGVFLGGIKMTKVTKIQNFFIKILIILFVLLLTVYAVTHSLGDVIALTTSVFIILQNVLSDNFLKSINKNIQIDEKLLRKIRIKAHDITASILIAKILLPVTLNVFMFNLIIDKNYQFISLINNLYIKEIVFAGLTYILYLMIGYINDLLFKILIAYLKSRAKA